MKQKSLSSVVSNYIVTIIISMLAITPVIAQNTEINIHYLGHSSFVIHFDNGLYVVADYGTSNAYGLASPIFSIGSLQPDIMTFSHQHEDHYNPSRIPGNVPHILTDLDTLSLAGLTIKPVRTSETSLSNKDNSSFIFTYKGLTLVHLADAQANIMNIDDTNTRNYIRQILPEKIDMLFMTIQGVYGFIPQAETFVDFLQPKRIIPIHYWTRQYKADFLQHLENQNQTAGKNYQIERQRGPKYVLSGSDTSSNSIKVISLEPAFFSDFDKPDIRYNGSELIDSQGNNNGRADAGETVNLVVNLDNYWIAAENVSAAIREDDPDVQVTSSVANLGAIGMEQNESNTANPFVFSVSATTIAHYTTFYLDIIADGGYSVVDSFTIIIGTPTILLIDDDGGDCYETCYSDILIPEIWDVAIKGCPTSDVLQAYQSVIWFTGDDRENSLTADEQSVIASFLDKGGRLFICGQNIAYDLDGDGSASDSLFLANCLHAQFHADSSNATVVLGITGDPISSGLMMSLAKTPMGEGNKTAPDLINAIAPEEVIAKYVPGMAAAGIKYENAATGARLVYLAFGIEKIVGPRATMAVEFTEKILTWLSGTTGLPEDSRQYLVAENYVLHQNFPNPFNPATTIQYSIPTSGFVTLKIYNLLGAEIEILVSKQQIAGTYRIQFNGEGFPSGIYFYQLRAGSFSATKKLVIVH